MMKIHTIALRAAMLAAVCFAAIQVANAGTIIKLNLGSDNPPDVGFSAGFLTTLNDGNNLPNSPGDQDTNVDFLDFLGFLPNIPAGASFSLSGIQATPTATQLSPPITPVGNTIIQNFTGGQLRLWDPAGVLLLGVNLGDSQLTGNSSPLPANGALFSTSFGSPIPGPGGGILAPQIAGNSVTLSIGLGDVNNGAGLSLSSITPIAPGLATGVLNNFNANATASIDALQAVPEPAAATLMLLAGLCGVSTRRRNG